MKDNIENYSKYEQELMFRTLIDSSLQNSNNKYWFICFDIELQKQLLEIFNTK